MPLISERKQQLVTGVGVVQRLDAEAIAREQQAAVGAIPDREREHALQPLDASLAFLFVEVQDRFGVAARAVAVPAPLEIRPQLRVVVDLAVEDDPHRLVFVGHRLVAAGHIDDRQAPVAEAGGTVDVEAGGVRTAVLQARRACARGARPRRARAGRISGFRRFHTWEFPRPAMTFCAAAFSARLSEGSDRPLSCAPAHRAASGSGRVCSRENGAEARHGARREAVFG